MKKITMMYLKGCPYCKQAMNWMEELKQEQPVYQNINITYIEESEQPQLAMCQRILWMVSRNMKAQPQKIKLKLYLMLLYNKTRDFKK